MRSFRSPRRSPVRPCRHRWAPRLEVLEARTVPTVNVGVSHLGLSNATYIPPDTVGAVGPNNFIEAVNLTLGYYDKNTGNLQSSQSLTTFFSPLGNVMQGSDPFVTYDTYAGKFVVGMLDYNRTTNNPSRLDFAVSRDSNPNDGWTFARYDMTHDPTSGTFFADYPRFGYNADAYVVTFNMFPNGGGSQHVDSIAISKSNIQTSFVHAFPTSQVGFPGMSPVVIHDGAAGGPVWFAGTAGQTGGSSIKLIKMTNELSSSPTVTTYSVSVPSYSSMPNPHQPGGSNMAWNFDTRVLNAAMINGDLVAAQNTGSGGYARARWYEFNTNGSSPSLIQSGSIAPTTTDTYFPTVEITRAGTIGMTYIESSTSEYMTMYVTGRTASDAQGTMETGVSPSVLHGTSRYTPSRAGDYSGISVDPNDGQTFWAANEFKGSGNPYNTGFASFNLPVAGVVTQYSVTASQNPVNAGAPFSLTVRALDANGNVVPGYRGTVSFSSDDPQASLPHNYTFTAGDNGVHTFTNVRLGTAGDDTIFATDTSNGSITGSVVVTVNPGSLDHFAVSTSAADPQVAGNSFDVTVTAQDAYGNTVTGYTGTITFSSADPYGASLPGDYPFQPGDQGSATFSGGATLYTAGTWDVTATDTATGISGSVNVAVQAAPAVTFQILAPASIPSGQQFDVTVIAQDPYGNTDTNYQGTITWNTTDGDPNVVLPADYPFQPGDQGQVTFPGGVTLISPGDQTLTVTDTSSGITGSTVVTVTAGPLAAVGTNPSRATPAVTPAPSTPALAPTASPAAPAVVDQLFVGSGSVGIPSVPTAHVAPALLVDASGGMLSAALGTDLTPDPLSA